MTKIFTFDEQTGLGTAGNEVLYARMADAGITPEMLDTIDGVQSKLYVDSMLEAGNTAAQWLAANDSRQSAGFTLGLHGNNTLTHQFSVGPNGLAHVGVSTIGWTSTEQYNTTLGVVRTAYDELMAAVASA